MDEIASTAEASVRRSRTSGIDRSLQILDLLSARGRPASGG